MVAAKLMAEWRDKYVKRMEIEVKTECELHAEKANVEVEAFGNPNPHAAGEVYVFSLHHRKDAAGFTICDAIPNHHTCVIEPYTTFLKGAFISTQLVPVPGTSLPAPQSSVSSMANITPVPKDNMLLDKIRPLSHWHSLNPSLMEPWDINTFNDMFPSL
ncbi:hypothetical protein BDR06DRAFT_966961 [Suillus hirtellus]|nr:hypothetical protein BDR06DRAFT_966961 [Suillus hirtellus]